MSLANIPSGLVVVEDSPTDVSEKHHHNTDTDDENYRDSFGNDNDLLDGYDYLLDVADDEDEDQDEEEEEEEEEEDEEEEEEDEEEEDEDADMLSTTTGEDIRRITFGSDDRRSSVEGVGKQVAKVGSIDDTKPSKNALFGKRVALKQSQRDEIEEAFNSFDLDGTGYMSTLDLKVALRALGFSAKKFELRRLLGKFDPDGTGKLNFNAFIRIIELKFEEYDTKGDLLKVFKLFDLDHGGYISFENLKDVAEELEEDINDEEIEEMIREADLDSNGHLDEMEFLKILRKPTLF